MYADDFNYWCRSRNIDTVNNFLQTTTNNIEKWANKTGFNFSPEKSIGSIFTKKKKVNELEIKLNGTVITNQNTTKMLGVSFDKRLTWLPYTKHLKKCTTSSLNIIKILSHTSWGGNSKSLIKIYNATIQSKLNYGAILYRTAAKSTLNLIDVVNNSGLTLALGSFRSSPKLSIFNIAGEPTPSLRRLELLTIYIVRLVRRSGNKQCNTKNEITEFINKNVASPVRIIPRELHITPPWENKYEINTELNTLSKQNTAPEIFKSHAFDILDNFKEHQMIFTDSSKSNQGVGISIIFENSNSNTTYRLPNECSIFSAEAIAILKAIEKIITSDHTDFLILSDSLSAINSIKNKTNPSDITILI